MLLQYCAVPVNSNVGLIFISPESRFLIFQPSFWLAARIIDPHFLTGSSPPQNSFLFCLLYWFGYYFLLWRQSDSACSFIHTLGNHNDGCYSSTRIAAAKASGTKRTSNLRNESSSARPNQILRLKLKKWEGHRIRDTTSINAWQRERTRPDSFSLSVWLGLYIPVRSKSETARRPLISSGARICFKLFESQGCSSSMAADTYTHL